MFDHARAKDFGVAVAQVVNVVQRAGRGFAVVGLSSLNYIFP
jgi:hypothetical protein